MFVTKNEAGEVSVLEADEDADVSVFNTLDGDVGDYIGPEDIEHAAAGIEPGSSAALLIWEDLWAAPLADAIDDAGGVVIEGARIPRELIAAAAELASSAT